MLREGDVYLMDQETNEVRMVLLPFLALPGEGPSKCDMLRGPCACGAWHRVKDWPRWVLIMALKEERLRVPGAGCSK